MANIDAYNKYKSATQQSKETPISHRLSYTLRSEAVQTLCILNKNYVCFTFTKKGENSAHSVICHASEFTAVLAKTVTTTKGMKAISLILLHQNHRYSVPLLLSRSLIAIASCWKYWANYYQLPMILEDKEKNHIHVDDDNSLVDILLKHKQKGTIPVQIRSTKQKLSLKLQLKNHSLIC